MRNARQFPSKNVKPNTRSVVRTCLEMSLRPTLKMNVKLITSTFAKSTGRPIPMVTRSGRMILPNASSCLRPSVGQFRRPGTSLSSTENAIRSVKQNA